MGRVAVLLLALLLSSCACHTAKPAPPQPPVHVEACYSPYTFAPICVYGLNTSVTKWCECIEHL